ncbi:hypothetical protein LDENG_00234230 [Lucifuga dentata]|nr:hypothetical protein LDENG_00234230 [Lucifuga dentata]
MDMDNEGHPGIMLSTATQHVSKAALLKHYLDQSPKCPFAQGCAVVCMSECVCV